MILHHLKKNHRHHHNSRNHHIFVIIGISVDIVIVLLCNNIYRVYTNKTSGYFTSKNDAISLIYYIPDAKIEIFNNITPIGIYQLKNKVLYFNNNEEKLEGYMAEWFQNKILTEKTKGNSPFSISAMKRKLDFVRSF
jgi:hypothetical protein